jgi:hypothetical protein
MLDAVEGPRFAMLCLGELAEIAMDYARTKIQEMANAGWDIGQAIRDWFSADDKVREMVSHGAHELVGFRERGEMVKTLLGVG